MKRTRWSMVLALALVAGVMAMVPLGRTEARGSGARAVLRAADGTDVGRVLFSPERGAVRVSASVRGLAPGFHGFHVHAVGKCTTTTTTFDGAGGHFNPDVTNHGDHGGDLVPLFVMEDGTGTVAFRTDRFRVSQLFDADGSAVIVHAAPDNLANVPARYHSHTYDVMGPDTDTLKTGDAGGRAACGVVT